MVKQIITAFPEEKKEIQKDTTDFLRISEFFYDTIQGEGINIGHPAAFLRMQNCTLNCSWCDTKEVWRYGNPYTFDELFNLIDQSNLISKLLTGQHLVFTGGSPMLQQDNLYLFITSFMKRYGFKPYIEVENECTRMPKAPIIGLINCWNNSPKLTSSGNKFELRYKPDIIKLISSLSNAWFKFVVTNDDDWLEIEEGFIGPGLIRKDQIILMPQGAIREELERNRPIVVELAVENGVRYSTREHIIIWDKKTGI